MYILVLEDDKVRQASFIRKLIGANVIIVETPQDAIAELGARHWDFLFLDHDLGGQQYVQPGDDTGYAVAKWLEENPASQPDTIVLHTLNSVGGDAMQKALPNAIRAPGCWTWLSLKDVEGV